jgi:hypothetical protein
MAKSPAVPSFSGTVYVRSFAQNRKTRARYVVTEVDREQVLESTLTGKLNSACRHGNKSPSDWTNKTFVSVFLPSLSCCIGPHESIHMFQLSYVHILFSLRLFAVSSLLLKKQKPDQLWRKELQQS